MRLIIAALGLALMFGCYVDNEADVRDADGLTKEEQEALQNQDAQADAKRIESAAQDQQDDDAKYSIRMCTSWEKVTGLGEEDILKQNEYSLIPGGKFLANGTMKATIWRRDVRPFIPKIDVRGCDDIQVDSYHITGYQRDDDLEVRNGRVCRPTKLEPIYQYLVITREALRCMREPESKLYCVEHKDAPVAPNRTSDRYDSKGNDRRDETLSGDIFDPYQVMIRSTGRDVNFTLMKKNNRVTTSNKRKGHEFDGLTYVFTDAHASGSQSGCPYDLKVLTVKGIVKASTKRKATKFDPFNN